MANIPPDIKILLLEACSYTSYEALVALSSTEKTFREIYRRYERRLLLNALKVFTGEEFFEPALIVSSMSAGVEFRNLINGVFKKCSELHADSPSLSVVQNAFVLHRHIVWLARFGVFYVSGMRRNSGYAYTWGRGIEDWLPCAYHFAFQSKLGDITPTGTEQLELPKTVTLPPEFLDKYHQFFTTNRLWNALCWFTSTEKVFAPEDPTVEYPYSEFVAQLWDEARKDHEAKCTTDIKPGMNVRRRAQNLCCGHPFKVCYRHTFKPQSVRREIHGMIDEVLYCSPCSWKHQIYVLRASHRFMEFVNNGLEPGFCSLQCECGITNTDMRERKLEWMEGRKEDIKYNLEAILADNDHWLGSASELSNS